MKKRRFGTMDFTALTKMYGNLKLPEYPNLRGDAHIILSTIWMEICRRYHRSGRLGDFSKDSPSALLFNIDENILIDNVRIAYGNPRLRAELVTMFFASEPVTTAIIDFFKAHPNSKRIEWNESPEFQNLIESLAMRAAECGLSKILEAQSIAGIFAMEKKWPAAGDFPQDGRISYPKIDYIRRWNHYIQPEGYERQPGLVPLDFEPESRDDVQGEVLNNATVKSFLDSLSARDRQIVEMNIQGYSNEKIAAKVGYSAESSVSRRKKAIEKMALAYGLKPPAPDERK